MEFHRKYTNYLLEKSLAQNTRAKHIQVIKTIMNEAIDQKLTKNLEFKNDKFKGAWKDGDAVYLTEAEITQLYKFDFSTNKRLEQVRDLFVFACYIGLRFSDCSAIKAENIVPAEKAGEFDVKLYTKKTRELVVIPCHPVVLANYYL